jgi:hypothetical protein
MTHLLRQEIGGQKELAQSMEENKMAKKKRGGRKYEGFSSVTSRIRIFSFADLVFRIQDPNNNKKEGKRTIF